MASSVIVCFLLSSSALLQHGRAFTSERFTTTAVSFRNDAEKLRMVANPLEVLLSKNPLATKSTVHPTIAEKFIENWNANRITEAMELVDDEVEFEDTFFPGPFLGKNQLERTLRLQSDINRNLIVVDDVANAESSRKIGVKFHTETIGGMLDKKGAASFVLDDESGLIKKVFLIQESDKSGEANLQTLRLVTSVTDLFKSKESTKFETKKALDNSTLPKKTPISSFTSIFFPTSDPIPAMTLPEQYFAAWNERDMSKACAVFSDSCEYDDTAFPQPFRGKEALKRHLNLCADYFPKTFEFRIDDQILGNDGKILVQWHVENNGEQLLFTRGCSFYTIENGKIAKGIDFVEPSIWKTGGVSLWVNSVISKVSAEPIRLVPLATWIVYMYVVFFSDWFYGLPATALEQRTWEEVRDLSLNFFLVSPILQLPFAPVVHPMLEGVFNLLLSWAALFAGFLSDDRPKKPNLLPMLPIVAGMQFLTSAFLLPYLVTRSNDTSCDSSLVYQEDLRPIARITERRGLPLFLTVVGSGSILWGIFARMDDFGGWNERVTSFLDLLSIDRVGSSFLVDLAIFAAFQGWLVNDDVKRRGMDPRSPLVSAAKVIPFFGMAAYLAFRDGLPTKEQEI